MGKVISILVACVFGYLGVSWAYYSFDEFIEGKLSSRLEAAAPISEENKAKMKAHFETEQAKRAEELAAQIEKARQQRLNQPDSDVRAFTDAERDVTCWKAHNHGGLSCLPNWFINRREAARTFRGHYQ